MTEIDPAAGTLEPDELEDVPTFPEPTDGPQDDVEQTTLPDFDEDLVDGASLEDEGDEA